MSAPLRIGLVGCGRLAEAGYLPAAALVPSVRVVAVADPDPERRALLAPASESIVTRSPSRVDLLTTDPEEQEGVAAYAGADELIGAGGIDAVVVASPPATHEEAARLAAAAGLPALVEKPPAPDLAGARRLAALDPPPWIGFNRRFSLGEGIAESVPAGGEVALALRYRRFSWSPVAVRDPALLDLLPHLADLALWAGIGTPRRVAARSRRPERIEAEVEGERARARLACATDRPHRERAVVRDAGGRVVVRRRVGGLARGLGARLRRGPHPLVASLAAQLELFALAARGEPAPGLAAATDGVAAMAIVAAAADSLARGGEPAAVDGLGSPAR